MGKKLVAFFSASGVTKEVAGKLAEAASADIYEIKPEIPYTDADLDWMNKKSRSSVEMNDKSFRPAMADELKPSAPHGNIIEGRILNRRQSVEAIKNWVESIIEKE